MKKLMFLTAAVMAVCFLTGHLDAAAGVGLAGVIGIPAPVLQSSQHRKIFTSTFTANTTDRIYSPTFPRSNFRSLTCYLSGTLTKTESVAGTLAENCLSLIRSIRIKLDGDVIKEFEPTMQRVYAHYIGRGQDSNLTMITTGTDTAEAFSARFSIDFQLPKSRAPEGTLLPGDRYGELSFEVDWGAYTDLITGTYTSVSFATTPTLEVWAEEILDPAIRAGRFLIHKQFVKTFAISSTAQTAAAYTLPVGETYRGILIKQLTRTPDVPISTLLASTGNIVVRLNGSFRKIETTWRELTQRNQAASGIALPTGYSFIDFMEDGDYRKALRTGDEVGVSSLELLVDTASVASAFMQVMPVTLKGAR